MIANLKRALRVSCWPVAEQEQYVSPSKPHSRRRRQFKHVFFHDQETPPLMQQQSGLLGDGLLRTTSYQIPGLNWYRASWRVHKEYSEYGKRSQEYEKGKRLCMIESGVLRSKYLVHQASLGKVNCSSLRRVWCHTRVSFVPLLSGIVHKQKQTHLRTRILSNLEGALYKVLTWPKFIPSLLDEINWQKRIWWNLYIFPSGQFRQ